MQKKIITVKYRRRREGKTNYLKRISLLKSNLPRLVVRKTHKHIYAQIVEYKRDGDRVITSSSSEELRKMGWKMGPNLSTAYLVGYLLGKKAMAHKVQDSIPDFGLHVSMKGSGVYAVVKGSLEAGLKVHHSPEALPSNERVQGKHIVDYFKMISANKAGNHSKHQFSAYKSSHLKIEELPKMMEEMKSKMSSMVK